MNAEVIKLSYEAKSLVSSRKPEAAMDCYAKILELEPLHPVAIINRALLLFSLGNHEAALKDFDQYFSLGSPDGRSPSQYTYFSCELPWSSNSKTPSQALLLFWRAVTRAKLRDTNGAYQGYWEAAEHCEDPKEKAWILQKAGELALSVSDAERSTKFFDAAISTDQASGLAYFYRGHAKEENGDQDGAFKDYTIAAQKDPFEMLMRWGKVVEEGSKKDQAKAHFFRGIAHVSLESRDQAISEMGQAIGLDPNQVGYLEGRASCFRHFGELELALQDLYCITRIDPDNLSAWQSIAILAQGSARYKTTVEAQTRLIALGQSSGHSFLDRGYAHFRLREYKEAIVDLDAAIAKRCGMSAESPSYIDPRLYKVMALNRLKKYELALRTLAEYFKKEKGMSADAFIERSIAGFGVQDYDAAARDIDRAFDLFDERDEFVPPIAYLQRAHVRRATGHFKDAINDYNKAIGDDYELGEAYFGRGLVHLSMGDVEAAKTDWRAGAKLGDLSCEKVLSH